MPGSYPVKSAPDQEAARLWTLHQLHIVNTTPEPIFEDYVAWAAQLFGVHIALISLIDTDFVWFKAITGVPDVPGLLRSYSMCSVAISVDAPVVALNYQFESGGIVEPDVAQIIGLRFYAGVALRAANGQRLGMLAITGKEARKLSAIEEEILVRLGELVSQTILLRCHYLEPQQRSEWDEVQGLLAQELDDNSVLASYLASHNQRIDFDDPLIAQRIRQRLAAVAQLLAQYQANWPQQQR